MKKLLIFLITTQLFAASYYVSNSGNDFNNGSSGLPWLTLQHAVNTVACGDTINVVANGFYVVGDVILPYISNCVSTTTIQSSLSSIFSPDGYRTNPTLDCTDVSHCLYGRLQLSTGIIYTSESHGSLISEYSNCKVGSITGGDTIVLSTCTQLSNLQNGYQIEIEINTINGLQLASPAVAASTIPVGLTPLTHYWVRDCSVSPACGTTGATMRLSATPGGAVLPIGSCLAVNFCAIEALGISEPLQFTANSVTITSPDSFTSIVNGTPVTLSAVGMQLFGTLPTGFLIDTIYYVQNISGRTFQLSTDLTGNNIIMPTNIGLGPSILANVNVTNNWLFKGLEFYSPGFEYVQLALGMANETSTLGMVHHIEVSHCWFHDDPLAISGVVHSIVDNAKNLYIHDNYITGARTAESQAISGSGSPGPTAIINNFLEAATEITLYGGSSNNSGVTNSNKLFQGNYYYKPPTWKIDATFSGIGSPGAPTVGVDACIYDNYDPLRSGGEWHLDTNTGINYRCQLNGTWGITLLSTPTPYTIKNSFEFKSAKNFTIIGNLHNYSWANNQTGQCYAFHHNYDSSAGAANNDIVAMNNKCLNVYYFVSAHSNCGISSAFPCLNTDGSTNYPKNHIITNNIAFENQLMCGVSLNSIQTNCGFHIIQNQWGGSYPEANENFSHNTLIGPDVAPLGFSFSFFYGADINGVPTNGQSSYWSYKNNILSTDFQGDGVNGSNMINTYFNHSNFNNNSLVTSNAGVSYTVPALTNSNTFTNFDRPVNNATIQYVSFSTNDFHLSSSSPYSASNGAHTIISDDGTDLGADVDLVNMATSGATLGTPPWDQKSGLRLGYGSTKVIFYLNTPGTGVCTASVYNAMARITANLVVSVADSAGTAISDVTRREIPVTSLTAGTQYWYKVDCGSGIVMPGSFVTKSAGSGTYNFLETYNGTQSLKICTDKAMSSGCTTHDSIFPVAVTTDNIVYWEVVPSTTIQQTISMLVAP